MDLQINLIVSDTCGILINDILDIVSTCGKLVKNAILDIVTNKYGNDIFGFYCETKKNEHGI